MFRGKNQLIKIVLLGDRGVGKSSLMKKVCDSKYAVPAVVAETRSVDVGAKIMMVDDEERECKIWDTPGKELNQSLQVSHHLRSADIILLCCDLTNHHSFLRLKSLLSMVRENASTLDPNHVIGLIGTKSDLVDEQAVSDMELRDFFQSNHLDFYMTCSAKDNTNVQEVFQQALKNVSMNNAKKNLDKDDIELKRSTGDLETNSETLPTVDELRKKYKAYGGGAIAIARIFGLFFHPNSSLPVIQTLRKRKKNNPGGASEATLNHYRL